MRPLLFRGTQQASAILLIFEAKPNIIKTSIEKECKMDTHSHGCHSFDAILNGCLDVCRPLGSNDPIWPMCLNQPSEKQSFTAKSPDAPWCALMRNPTYDAKNSRCALMRHRCLVIRPGPYFFRASFCKLSFIKWSLSSNCAFKTEPLDFSPSWEDLSLTMWYLQRGLMTWGEE